MSMRYMMVVRQSRSELSPGVTIPLCDVPSLRDLKKFVVDGLSDLVLSREQPIWLRSVGASAKEPFWGTSRTPDCCFVTIHRYVALDLRVDLSNPSGLVAAWTVRWTGQKWRVFQLNNPKVLAPLSHERDGTLVTTEPMLGKSYELTIRRLRSRLEVARKIALRGTSVNGHEVQLPKWELSPYAWCGHEPTAN